MSDRLDPSLFLKDLLKIPSPSGHEEKIATYLKNFLSNHKFQILPSKMGNVIGIRGQGHPILLLASHMDTVPGGESYCEEGDKISCRGATDCKPSWASIFYSAATYEAGSFNGTIIVAGLIQEEVSLIGVEDLFKVLEENGLFPDAAVFGEPTIIDRICVGYRGRLALKVEGTTSGGHSSSPWEYDNLIELNQKFYSQIQIYCQQINSNATEKGRFAEITATMTSIHAGELDNSLPSTLNSTIDIRIPPSISSLKLIKKIENIFNEIKGQVQQSDDTTFKFTILFNYDAVEVESDAPVLSAFRWAGFQVLKKKPSLVKKTGSTFTNLIQAHYISQNPKFRCITYGPGDPRLEHTDKEFISLQEYLNSIEIYKKFYPKFVEIFQKS